MFYASGAVNVLTTTKGTGDSPAIAAALMPAAQQPTDTKSAGLLASAQVSAVNYCQSLAAHANQENQGLIDNSRSRT